MSKKSSNATTVAAVVAAAGVALAATAQDQAGAELQTDGAPEPGEVDGALGADVQPVAATHVEARVLCACAFGKPNDLALVPVGQVDEAVAASQIDVHPEAVRYAKRLAAGEIEA